VNVEVHVGERRGEKGRDEDVAGSDAIQGKEEGKERRGRISSLLRVSWNCGKKRGEGRRMVGIDNSHFQ